jgi:hypothetical protein
MDKTRKAGPMLRFAEIEARLKTSGYNRATRKLNRNYLSKYMTGRGTEGSDVVEARKAHAVALLSEIDEYKSPIAKAPSPLKRTRKAPLVAPVAKPIAKPLFEQVDVKGDGNCFYRALYRAAKGHEDPTVLAKVFTALGADKSKMGSEETGQNALRKAIAEYYRTKLPMRFGPYEMLISNYGSTQFRGWLREATSAQADLFKKVKDYAKLPEGKKRFYADLATVIGTNNEYASEIDYFMIKDILEEGGVRMISSKESPLVSVINKVPIVYVKRLSFDHYNYWRLIKRVTAPVVAAPVVAAPVVAAPVVAAPVVAPPVVVANAKAKSPPKPLSPTPPPRPMVKPAPTNNSGESTNNSNEERQREELLTQLERRVDRHTRCVEKCKSLARKVEEVKKELGKLGK